mgnify:CR=1 FL=1
MNFKNAFTALALLMGLLLMTACGSQAQSNEKSSEQASSSQAAIEVIQFHSEHRCMTCQKIEKLTQKTLESYSDIPFSLVNVDKGENAAQANEFEAAGTALFLHNPATGAKKNLTQYAFMNAGNEEKFVAGLKEEIDEFSKQ